MKMGELSGSNKSHTVALISLLKLILKCIIQWNGLRHEICNRWLGYGGFCPIHGSWLSGLVEGVVLLWKGTLLGLLTLSCHAFSCTILGPLEKQTLTRCQAELGPCSQTSEFTSLSLFSSSAPLPPFCFRNHPVWHSVKVTENRLSCHLFLKAAEGLISSPSPPLTPLLRKRQG